MDRIMVDEISSMIQMIGMMEDQGPWEDKDRKKRGTHHWLKGSHSRGAGYSTLAGFQQGEKQKIL